MENFRAIIYSHSYIYRENLAKISQIDFEVIGLIGIVEK